jgi:hypothetical protein
VKRSTRPSRRTIKGGSAGGCAPAAAASRFRNSDSTQTLSKLGNAGNTVEGMRRGVWARFSGTRGCGILPATVALVRLQDGGVSRGFHREPWDFRLRNFFHMLHAQGFTGFGEACGLDVVGLRPAPKRLPRTFDLPHPPL